MIDELMTRSLQKSLSQLEEKEKYDKVIEVIVNEKTKKIRNKETVNFINNLNKCVNSDKSNNNCYEIVEKYLKRQTSDVNKISTGRSTIWKKNIDYIINNNYLLVGKGVLADMKLFNITSSNSLIYAWISGGIFCALLYIFIVGLFFISNITS